MSTTPAGGGQYGQALVVAGVVGLHHAHAHAHSRAHAHAFFPHCLAKTAVMLQREQTHPRTDLKCARPVPKVAPVGAEFKLADDGHGYSTATYVGDKVVGQLHVEVGAEVWLRHPAVDGTDVAPVDSMAWSVGREGGGNRLDEIPQDSEPRKISKQVEANQDRKMLKLARS
ncbi:hypothetical protein B0T17DRAFT_504567 [Bombardia bombarda]|uniref:Uncharacterized protein n=1 Tax=Bombardia bombarda TaxID=252184 RepID=A0AA39XPV6_9PEZI|nr:hypothetical protein B0T17DRAFT_504567 [Bombardia bombarda]